MRNKKVKVVKKPSKSEFERYLERVEDPNYQGGSWALPEKASLLEKIKYEICQKVLDYHLDKNLTTDETAKKMKLSKAETEDILHCRLDYFTLDRLTTHVGYLFALSKTKKSKMFVWKLLVNFVIPKLDFSKKNDWYHWTEKEERKGAYVCDKCILNLYKRDKLHYLSLVENPKKRQIIRVYVHDGTFSQV